MQIKDICYSHPKAHGSLCFAYSLIKPKWKLGWLNNWDMFYSLKEEIQNVSMDVLPDLCISPSRTTTGKCNPIRFVWDSRLSPPFSNDFVSPAKPSNHRNRLAESRGTPD